MKKRIFLNLSALTSRIVSTIVAPALEYFNKNPVETVAQKLP